MAKRYSKKDKFSKREAERYSNPVASREHIARYLEDIAEPANYSQLADALSVVSDDEREGFTRRLKAMCRDGQLMYTRGKKYALITEMDMVTGRVQSHRDGYGFLLAEDGREDIFLSARQMQGLFNEDRVVVQVVRRDERRRPDGVVVEILERGTQRVVGRYFEDNGTSFVEPHNKNITQDILISKVSTIKVNVGDYVVVEIIAQPSLRRQPMGRVMDVLGNELTPGLEVELAIQAHQIPSQWSKEALEQAQRYGENPNPKDYKGRTDLRELAFATIDGEDARDFDDAIYCCAIAGGGWQLQVAIADVSFYVALDTALDQAAQERGNSVYFPSCVMPMIPECLSNGLCSLRPKVDRLVMVCDMTLSEQGQLLDYSFYEAVIHSKARMTYHEVAQMLEGKQTEHYFMLEHMKAFHHLYKKLLNIRSQRGSIEFETIETKVLFNKQGRISEIIPSERNVAHRMIEEAMLLANTCAATKMSDSELAGLYRIHEAPEPDRMEELRKFLHGFGLRMGGGKKPHAKDYSHLLKRIQKRKDAALLQTVLLRSMQRAVYATEDKGHFALSFPAYTHFTSPIRRYPDLIVHRIIKCLLAKDGGDQQIKPIYEKEAIHSLADHFSMTERRADLATRDALDWLKCHFMQDKVAGVYQGTICDVTAFGIFVQLDDVYVSGLIHISNLPGDYYQHDAGKHLLRGKKSGRQFRLGDGLKIQVARVDLDKRQIDFEIAS